MSQNDQGNLVQDVMALGLAGPAQVSAVKAIKTLLFGTADYAAAWFERWSAEVRAGTAARLTVSDAAARAAASHIHADVELAERAVQSWLPQAIRNQANREAVAKDFLIELGAGKERAVPDNVISDDWIERYAEFAGKISEEDLRFVLARILVKEISAPGSVPISTLRIIAELDAETAKTFEIHADYVFEGKWLFYPDKFADEPLFEEMLNLAAAGLITYPDTATHEGFMIEADKPYMIECGDFGVSLEVAETQELMIRSIPLTRAGRQIYNALNVVINEKTARSLADSLIPLVVKADLYVRDSEGWRHLKGLIETIDGNESDAGN